MNDDRRSVLAAGAAALVAGAGKAQAQETPQGRPPHVPEGHPGDFDFLTGEWRIHHRWRASADSTEWLEFDGEATVVGILGGICSVEELRVPARNFFGMGLRLLDQTNKVWQDHWVNKQSGVITAPGEYGGFVDGVGTWSSTYDQDGVTMISQGVWDEITPTTARWRQRVSADGGATWEETWIMHWRRA